MAFKKRTELKDVFNGLSSLYYTPTVADLSSESTSIAWEYDLPVTVDTLQVAQDDPTISHYKIIGEQGDWAISSQSGEFNVKFTVPTKHTDILKIAFGVDAHKALTGVTMTGGDAEGTWNGSALAISMHKVTGTIALLDETKKNMMIITDVVLYAKPLYENPSTEPFAIQFTGSIETSGSYNFAWLTKAG